MPDTKSGIKPGKPLAAIVLAAGASLRMGGKNKLLLDYRGRPLVAHAVSAMFTDLVGEVIVVTGHDHQRVEAAIRDSVSFDRLRFVMNDRSGDGLATSIRAGVIAIPAGGVSGYIICLGDLPLIETTDVKKLADEFASALRNDPLAIVAPRHKGRQGHPVVFSAAYRERILNERGPGGCRGLLVHFAEHVVWVEMASRILADVDTPEEYTKLQG